MQSTEKWAPVLGFEDIYEVSTHGRVRRVAGGRGAKPGHILRTNTNGRAGHLWVTLYRDCIGTKSYVHRLVAQAFVPGPVGPVVRHKDDDPSNNVTENLAWGTQGDNVADMIRAGRARNGREHITVCPRGHDYDEQNTYISRKGSRTCRACQRDRMRAKYWNDKENAA